MGVDLRTALVTGASRGIGRAIALQLAADGFAVAVNYAGSEAKANEVVEEIISAGGKAFAIQGDVSRSDQVDEMVQKVLAEFGRIDVLVNNAGITRDNLLMRLKEEDWDAVLDTNLKGLFLCSKSAIKPMIKQRSGRIINITSVVGQMGNAGQGNYAAAKAGVIGLTKTLAKELGSRNITVNAVAPGYIQTDMTDKLSDEVRESLAKTIPLGRLGQPEDVAKVVAFLASESAKYITGQTINVDGGMVMA
ncbi:3-oxoacyl-[acyl-carrier-protein] reductase [Heliobacillus mobilis]|uniref:3-oxoacyl-[acyl-carrier-protein] reductase n=3 Tax=Heliobacterium TaxID=2697 RepID=A0A6I3SB71_HELMO|nr:MULTISPECIES: 3-oxoacyl-[acyl-carrier-protein] reductase [Heliobacterium]MBC9783359.1 3-oxoacyl-[acyl-carrier-protein] reductase [Heliobacterium chlorum]MTV47667.1 3-oxoacyl-[acyl-carrier-protein] reductase [Heliobacterium mobile]